LEAIDRNYPDDLREMRELVAEAKDEAENGAPNGLRLRSILGYCRDAVQTFAALDPSYQALQRIAQTLFP